ncbi:hypothetical protein LTR27_002139 [Elasticomyces elasticus]|nr:hypothetical protein LTR27_002139 [Elasticomyces elasticus]
MATGVLHVIKPYIAIQPQTASASQASGPSIIEHASGMLIAKHYLPSTPTAPASLTASTVTQASAPTASASQALGPDDGFRGYPQIEVRTSEEATPLTPSAYQYCNHHSNHKVARELDRVLGLRYIERLGIEPPCAIASYEGQSKCETKQVYNRMIKCGLCNTEFCMPCFNKMMEGWNRYGKFRQGREKKHETFVTRKMKEAQRA